MIMKMWELSTIHLTKETVALMKLDAVGVKVYSKGGYGFFVYVPEDELKYDVDSIEGVPEDLFYCLKIAYKLGCDWIMFDCDAAHSCRLPKYDW